MKVISARSTWYVRKLFIMVRQNEDQIVLVSRNVTVLGQVCKNVTEALKKEREREGLPKGGPRNLKFSCPSLDARSGTPKKANRLGMHSLTSNAKESKSDMKSDSCSPREKG